MKISFEWLREYVDIKIPVGELANRLTMAGLEVESVEDLGAKYDRFVVGQVLDVKKHPSADRLTVCKVDVGKQRLDIVCGAPNVAIGQKVPIGLVGAVIPRNQHDPEGMPFVLELVKIRGVESNGMICSEYELGLGGDTEGILVLDESAVAGTSLAEYLGSTQTVLEIGLTPNRPDCMSHVGVAREVASLLGTKLKRPAIRLKESRERTDKYASVRIEDIADCPRYTARVIRGVKVASSPKWLQEALKSVGLRPVNNVVDVTNYVLMELGHPLHPFDYDRLAGGEIIVRRAKEGERFTTLDGKQRNSRSDTLMICDAKQPVAIAGVMGGANTEISEKTVNVLLESAYFDPKSIRRTSKYLGLSTDASQRFERGVDPNFTRYAADRASQLIQELCGGEILRGAIDVYPHKIRPRPIHLRAARLNEVLGTDISESEIIRILRSLDVPMKERKQSKPGRRLVFPAPTFRPDLEREIDLIEEVARIHGYDRIETKISTDLKLSSQPVPADSSDHLREFLVGEGYREIVTNSLQKKSVASLGNKPPVEILNPISEDMAALRTSLVPGTLDVIRYNIHHGRGDLKLFEIGNVFCQRSGPEKGKYFDQYLEDERIILAQTGLTHAPGWEKSERPTDIFDLKGTVERLLTKIFLDKFRFIYYSRRNTLTEFSVDIEFNGGYVGFLGKLNADITMAFEVEQAVYVAELLIESVKEGLKRKPSFQPLPKYPSVFRDLAFVVDDRVSAAEIEECIRSSAGDLLKRVRLFDLYTGDQIEHGKKSCAFSLEFLSPEKTLTEEEIESATEKVIQIVSQKLDARLRS
ncbi:MAG: phenylalanine--tRNA ligase subunit beta [Bacteroidota bacterium]